VQLFNLKNDIEEENDLSSQEPGKVKELLEILHNWQKASKAKLMKPNPDYSLN